MCKEYLNKGHPNELSLLSVLGFRVGVSYSVCVT